MINNLNEILTQFNVCANRKKAIIEDLNEMITYRQNPSELWGEPQGTGCYKECYIIDNIAIKFAAIINCTENREQIILQDIAEHGFDKIFAKTSFVYLDNKTLPSSFIEINWDDEYELSDYDFDYIIIQEKVPDILGMRDRIYPMSNYGTENKLYDENGNFLPYTTIESLIRIFFYQEWTQAAINFYGIDFMLKLVDYCNHKGISDFHIYNIGFRDDGSPVIFDFIS